ncbi:MAG: hypothetical protein IT431_06640 [Phycisphaerales bacterium]|nr:hypothetical protein [Phycisphaerales bacterium]
MQALTTWWMVLLTALAACGAPARAQDDAGLAGRLLALDAQPDWRSAFALGQEAAEADGGPAALREVWGSIGSVRVKQQLVKAWHFDLPAPFRVRFHPDSFAFYRMVLEAGDEEVSAWTLGYLPAYAWAPLENGADAIAWLRTVEGRDPAGVFVEGQRRWRDAWRDGADAERAALGEVLADIGHPYRGNDALIRAAEEDGVADLFAWIVANPGVAGGTRLSAFAQLRSIRPGEYDDAAWEALRAEVAQDGADGQPALTSAAEPAAPPVRLVDDDPAKRWILHPPTGPEPEAGYGLLIVLPGGDGSPEFAGFVAGAIRDGAGPDFAVVQMIAPPIDAGDGDAVVWPTEQLPDGRVPFTIEPVVAGVLGQVRAELRLDPARVYTMGWSSGGPPAYGLSLREGLGVRGAFVIMSVFKPESLPPLGGARGKAYFILHSPDDFIKMHFPEAARDALAKHGARVRLETYEGGHGWQGDSIARIGDAVRWLDGKDEDGKDEDGKGDREND